MWRYLFLGGKGMSEAYDEGVEVYEYSMEVYEVSLGANQNRVLTWMRIAAR